MAGESGSAVEGNRIFQSEKGRKCRHVRGDGSTLHVAYCTDGSLRKDNGTDQQVYFWYCYCDVCNHKTDLVMTVGEAMERAEFGWWRDASFKKAMDIFKAWRKGKPDPKPAPTYEYESDIWDDWEKDRGLA